MTDLEPVIGLEVHIELATRSKMFCGCPADHFGKTPNTQTCPVCLGLPGALPVPNKKAVEWTILLGLALGCGIRPRSKFDRKNYFYPDLPKGYQISQYDEPLCEDGKMLLAEKTIKIRRVHLEEDTGKLQHAAIGNRPVSLVDFNRSGVPLVEVVTDPDFTTIEEVDLFLKRLQRTVRYLGISSADMEKGSMRLEPSISLRPRGETTLPSYRVELKNINSFRFARKALEFEIKRQQAQFDDGEQPNQQTRGWNEAKNETFAQRSKEEANDYRYFPEPDIPPVAISDKWKKEIGDRLPELPDDRVTRLIRQYGLSDYGAQIIVEDRATADYFEQAARDGADPGLYADIANWIINKRVDILTVVPAQLVQMIVQSKQVSPVDEDELDKTVSEVLSQNPTAVADYRKGKTAVVGFLLGCLVKKLPSVDRKIAAQKLTEHLAV